MSLQHHSLGFSDSLVALFFVSQQNTSVLSMVVLGSLPRILIQSFALVQSLKVCWCRFCELFMCRNLLVKLLAFNFSKCLQQNLYSS